MYNVTNIVNYFRGYFKLKLTVIGEWGSYPKKGGASAGFLLQANGFTLLIDCGSAVLSKLQKLIDLSQLDAVIISHYHADHIADIGVLQHGCFVEQLLGKRQEQLVIYGHDKNKTEFSKLTYKNVTVGQRYNPNEQLKIGPFSITFLQTNHSVPCYAMKIVHGDKSLVYTADTAFFPQLIEFCRSTNLLLAECSFYGEQVFPESGHMNSFDVGKLANGSAVEAVCLCHLPHFGQLENLITEVQKFYDGEVMLATSMLTFKI